MESSQSKAEVLKPVILKAGVPLALSLAGFIYAWIISKKSISKTTSLSQTEPNSPETDSRERFKRGESFHSLAFLDEEEEYAPADSSVLAESSVTHENPCFEQEINVLRSKIEGLRLRELALRLQFDQYCDLKEQESMLTEVRNTLSLDTARAEFLNRELSYMEEENKRLENFLLEYLRIIEQLEFWKSQNRLLQRKVKKLLRKSKAQSRLTKEQTLMIKAGEAEILRNRDALQTRTNVISKLEDEIKAMQRVLDKLQEEKNELLKKLDTAEKSHALKIEAGIVSKEDYDNVLNELEQLKNDRAAEVKELICLRWTNACLRHELMRRNEQQKQQNHERDHIELDFEGNGGIIHYESDHQELDEPHLEHHHPCFGTPHIDHSGSRRKKLLKRLKKWVEGGEKERVKPKEKDRHEYDDRHSVSCGAEQPQIPARLSCSSA